MNEVGLITILETVSDRVRKAFDVKEPTPKIKFVKEIPDVTAFGYDLKGNCHIAINPSYTEAQYSTMQWALSEEVAHFCHYTINLPLFKENVQEFKRKDRKSNNRLLEISNLMELVARIGGFYGGMIPPDYKNVINNWESVMKRSSIENEKEFKGKMKIPEYNDAVFMASSRVWGASLGDILMEDMMTKSRCLPESDLLRSVAATTTFREAGESVKRYAPNLVKEFETVTNTFFN